MSARTLIVNPNPLLRKKSENVEIEEILTDDLQNIIDDLQLTMKKENGIGIAAPQIGINKRIIIVDIKDGPKALINPIIVSRSFRKGHFVEEGCLSVPGVWGYVTRNKSVKIKALDRNGKAVTLKVIGIDSVAFQHEIDHLDGVLFIDKVDEYTRQSCM